jgi:hypothetical protein
MLVLLAKAALAGVMIALIAQIGQRLPALGALIASLPLVSVLGMIFLWQAKPDPETMATHMTATFWYVLPSLPMFLVMPILLKSGVGFAVTLAAGCALTIALYLGLSLIAPRWGISL